MESMIEGEAVLHYDNGAFTILQMGTYVNCAISAQPIMLSQLRYWSVERQEAYTDAQTAVQAWQREFGKE